VSNARGHLHGEKNGKKIGNPLNIAAKNAVATEKKLKLIYLK